MTFPPKYFIFDQAVEAERQLPGLRRGGRRRRRRARRPNRPAFAAGRSSTCSRRTRQPVHRLPAGRRHAPAAPRTPALQGDRQRCSPARAGSTSGTRSSRRRWRPGRVPAFNYMILPNDHTNGTTPGDSHAPGDDRRQRPRARARSSTRSRTPRSGRRPRSSSSRTTRRTAPTTSTRTARRRS